MPELNIISYPCSKNRCYIQGVKRTPIGIQVHSIGCAQGTAQSVADYWNSPNVKALVQYICDSDTPGKVLYTLPESCYSWADAGYGNRNLITIEMCESDFMKYQANSASFTITNEKQFKADIRKSYATAVLLCIDICKRYNWDPMSKLPSGLFLISSHDEGRRAGLSSDHVDPTHVWTYIDKTMNSFREDVRAGLSGKIISAPAEIKWFRVRRAWTDVQSQLGAYEDKQNAINNCPNGYAVYDSDGKEIYRNAVIFLGTQASDFAGLSESAAAKKILDIVHNSDDSGILNSVTAAQCILESGYVITTLAKVANNCFGMKVNLSGNTWSRSSWDGKSKVTLPTWEVYNGKSVTINADFRQYVCIEESIKDHAAYLLGAMNGDKKRYAGLLEAKDYREAITIIKNGGYATDPNYISKICNIIQRFGLDKYDGKPVEPKPVVVPDEDTIPDTTYRVQIGMFDSLTGAKVWANFVHDKTKLDTGVEKTSKGWQVICGSFKSLAYADARKYLLMEEFKIEAFVSETKIAS